jgi:hypothetical protein
MIARILIILFLALTFSCIPYSEKQACEYNGCSDTDLEFLVISCPLFSNLQSFDCKNYSPSTMTV